MALVAKNRILETSTTTGTGNITVLGAPIGHNPISTLGIGNTFRYTIEGRNLAGTELTGQWETGTGTVTASGFSRDTVEESSNSNNLVNFSSPLLYVFNHASPTDALAIRLDGTSVPVVPIPFYAGTETQGAIIADGTPDGLGNLITIDVRSLGVRQMTIGTVFGVPGITAQNLFFGYSDFISVFNYVLVTPGNLQYVATTKHQFSGAVEFLNAATAADNFSFAINKGTFYGSTTVPNASITSNGTDLILNSKVTGSGNIAFTDGNDVRLGSTNGNRIGLTGDKVGFLGATPIVRQNNTTDLGSILANFGFRNSGSAYPITTTGAVSFGGTSALSGAWTISGSGGQFTTNNFTIRDVSVVLTTTTGTSLGTATNQKLSFYGSTPIVQPVATLDLGTVLSNLGLRAAGTAYPITTSGAVSFTGTIGLGGAVTVTDAINFAVGTTTGTKWGTATTQKQGWYNATPVVQQTDGAALTNNVTVGGTTDTIADFTDLIIYANDAAAIRNDIYQLARKVKIIGDALRTYGLLS